MEKTNYQVSVNGKVTLTDAHSGSLDFRQTGPDTYHVLLDQVAYHATLDQVDYVNKSFTFRIQGNAYEVKLADRFDQMVESLGFSAQKNAKVKDLKAPMPGLVLELLVEPGQAVQKGDSLIILEAMKMENVLKASGDGVVKALKVEKAAAVTKGQVLLEME
jgi:biotin carboxyl carrier protein